MFDFNQLASDYAQHRRPQPEVLRHLLEGGGLRADARVLEVGCGTANYLKAIHTAVGCRCHGIDPSERMLAEARAAGPGLELKQARAEQLGCADGIFDLVFSVDVIHHVTDRPRYFAEAHRALKPGGRLCTVTDSEWMIRHRLPMSFYFPETIPIELARYPKIGSLRQMMQAAGFTAVNETTVEIADRLADLGAYRSRAFSCLQLITNEAWRRGLARMEADGSAGPIPSVSRYLMLWGMKQGGRSCEAGVSPPPGA